MIIAVMQPYFFPYLGYFQLINAVDKFVFYDDVNFIKKGWVNRNRIIVNNKEFSLTIQLIAASQNKQIKNLEILSDNRKVLKTIKMAYRKAPFFDNFYPIVESVLLSQTNKLSELAILSIKEVGEYLGLKTVFEVSSISYPETIGLNRSERLKKICKLNDSQKYINAVGGQLLYSKEDFIKDGIELFFLKPNLFEYTQFNNKFIAGLSIIDVLMFNSVSKVKEMLNSYMLL